MATAYVSSSGTAAYPGTASVPTSISSALSSAGAGDIIYIAPGNYVVNNVTYGGASGTAGNPVQFIGNPTGSQFTGIPAGRILFTATSDLSTGTGAQVLTLTSKSYVNFSNITFDRISAISNVFTLTTCANVIISNCVFYGAVTVTNTGAVPNNNTFTKCVLYGTRILSLSFDLHTSNYNNPYVISDCLFIMINYGGFGRALEFYNTGSGAGLPGGGLITNCTLFGGDVGINHYNTLYDTTNPFLIRNNLFMCQTAIFCTASARVSTSYNRYTFSALSGASSGTGSTSNGVAGIDLFESLLYGINNLQPFSSYQSSPNTSFGTSTGAPLTDLYGVTWTGTSPDAGSGTYRPVGGVGPYLPSDRNASTITIAPGSTSQSIELYLGATGLTASTSGLSAYYNRTRSADVQINLQARNITQNWTSGGFAEVNPNTMPGVYRLDIPNEALAAGADDVTVVVRGASGTNGAVMSIKLSSGGLTTAQTASAVWNALTNDHTTHGTFGWNVLRADQDSKEGLVTLHQSGGVSRVDADIHAVVNDTAAATAFKGALLHDGTGYVDSDVVRISTSAAAANELEGALLHNGTDYIDANLLSGNSTRVFVGRFQMTQTGTTQGDIIEAFTTDTPAFELQLFDGDNNLVPVTGATLGLRILDVTSTVVETGTPTIEYGTGGIVRWTAPGTYLSIGCPAGMYRMFVDRTVSGTTTTFGPLQIKVQVQ